MSNELFTDIVFLILIWGAVFMISSILPAIILGMAELIFDKVDDLVCLISDFFDDRVTGWTNKRKANK